MHISPKASCSKTHEALPLLLSCVRLWPKLRGELKPLWPLMGLPHLGREVDLDAISIGNRHSNRCTLLIVNPVPLEVELHDLFAYFCRLPSVVIVPSVALLREIGILGLPKMLHLGSA